MPAGRIAEERRGPLPLPLPDELLAKSGFLMVRLGMAFKTRAIQELEAAGFSQYHYSVLAILGEQSRKAQASVAEALGVDPSQLVGILDGLEERGLIARQRDPDDRRRHVITLTAAGRRQLVRLRSTFEQLEDELLSPLDDDSRKALHALLLRLASHRDPLCPGASR
jgi:DNA-binding MarR family transcriptional regulator